MRGQSRPVNASPRSTVATMVGITAPARLISVEGTVWNDASAGGTTMG